MKITSAQSVPPAQGPPKTWHNAPTRPLCLGFTSSTARGFALLLALTHTHTHIDMALFLRVQAAHGKRSPVAYVRTYRRPPGEAGGPGWSADACTMYRCGCAALRSHLCTRPAQPTGASRVTAFIHFDADIYLSM